jgi:hypothetical protein
MSSYLMSHNLFHIYQIVIYRIFLLIKSIVCICRGILLVVIVGRLRFMILK